MTAKWLFATLCAGCLACSCSEKPERWDFDNLDGLVCTHQDDNPARQIECRNGVMKIFTRANSRDRKKVRTVGSDYGAGRYTWRVYIPEMGVGDQASVGAFIYHDDQHELDFEIGYGPQEVRERIGAKPGEMVAYMTTQDNPHQSVQVPIVCGWHTCDIELSLRDGRYYARWLIDGNEVAAVQQTFGPEITFTIMCSVENLLFIGDHIPAQDNYGLFDYMEYLRFE